MFAGLALLALACSQPDPTPSPTSTTAPAPAALSTGHQLFVDNGCDRRHADTMAIEYFRRRYGLWPDGKPPQQAPDELPPRPA